MALTTDMNTITYFRTMLKLHRDLLLSPITALQGSKNASVATRAANFRMKLKRSDIRFGFDKAKELFYVTRDTERHFFGNLHRGIKIYSQGVDVRATKLFDSYLLGQIDFAPDDIVVDCGANYGDLWLSLKDKLQPENYITFEPGEMEHASIRANAPLGRHVKMGLSDKAKKTTF